jgi:hypothetical protein
MQNDNSGWGCDRLMSLVFVAEGQQSSRVCFQESEHLGASALIEFCRGNFCDLNGRGYVIVLIVLDEPCGGKTRPSDDLLQQTLALQARRLRDYIGLPCEAIRSRGDRMIRVTE